MTETATLKHAAARLYAARERAEQLATYFKAYEDEFYATHADLLHKVDDAQSDAIEAENALRTAALAEYEATGKKALGHGVGIRVQKRLRYDRDQALRWAYANRKALALDAKAFEKIAKDDDTIDFVVTEEEPTVTLPRDAAMLLGEGER